MTVSRVTKISILCGITCFSIGILIGRFAINRILTECVENVNPDGKGGNNSISQELMREIKAENIRKNLEFFTRRPHIAGSQQDEEVLLNHIVKEWKAQLDGVKIYSYKVLLSYPNASDPNYVALVLENGTEVEQSAKVEKAIFPEQNDSTVATPFNAYSPSGTVTGDLVYVNYGTIEDFMYLKRNLSIDLNGKIAIARYGKIFRGDKASHAAQFGCSGMILYSDPSDYAVSDEMKVYPDDWWLPGTGVQRGTLLQVPGDVLTPFYPSIESAYFNASTFNMPSIPVTPISYNDAVKYLSKLDGHVARQSWHGKLNITYRTGPGFVAPHNTSKMKLYVRTFNERRITKNVIGFIRGQYEPDRYVIIGNHRDAWVFGAVDPSSGTASIMELSRAMGKLLKNGWRPRRSIIFCSWGSEEYNLIGSSEWVEEMVKPLSARAVAYINIDCAIEGNVTLYPHGTPNLYNLIQEVAKKVENPDPKEYDKGRRTVYDTWLANIPSDYDPSVPQVGDLGSGSDYTAFLQTLGCSAVDLLYSFSPNYNISSYPVYHSAYETFDLVSRFMDQKFTFHQAVTRIAGELALTLADSVLLKLDCNQYAQKLERIFTGVQQGYGTLLNKHNITLDWIKAAIQEFKEAAAGLHNRIEKVNLTNPLEVRAVNDQLMNLERAFIDPMGIYGRPHFRHVIYAPSKHNAYASTSFPGLADALFDIENDENQDERREQVKKEISIIAFTIRSAASTIRTVSDIGGC